MCLPSDIWEYILELVQDWKTLQILSHTIPHLWYYVRSPQFPRRILLEFVRYSTEKYALETANSWQCQLAVLDRKCQLCKKTYPTGFTQPTWDVYAHSHCLSKEVISIIQAVKVYDLPFEKLVQLPKQNNMVWKYHGGRSCLSFSVMSTIQGLCLTLCNESLHDRRKRIELIRAQVQDVSDVESRKRKHQEYLQQDNLLMETERKARLGNLRQFRELHLQPLLVKYRILPELCEKFRSAIYNNISMRLPWRKLEVIIREWGWRQHRVDYKVMTFKELLT